MRTNWTPYFKKMNQEGQGPEPPFPHLSLEFLSDGLYSELLSYQALCCLRLRHMRKLNKNKHSALESKKGGVPGVEHC